MDPYLTQFLATLEGLILRDVLNCALGNVSTLGPFADYFASIGEARETALRLKEYDEMSEEEEIHARQIAPMYTVVALVQHVTMRDVHCSHLTFLHFHSLGSSHTNSFTQLISFNSQYTSSRTTHLTQTQLTPLISHNYIAPLISHNSSHETQLNQIIAYNSHKHNSPNSSHTCHLSPFTLYNRHDTNLLLPFVLHPCLPNT